MGNPARCSASRSRRTVRSVHSSSIASLGDRVGPAGLEVPENLQQPDDFLAALPWISFRTGPSQGRHSIKSGPPISPCDLPCHGRGLTWDVRQVRAGLVPAPQGGSVETQQRSCSTRFEHVTFGSLSNTTRLGVPPLMAREDRAAGSLDAWTRRWQRGWMKITEVTEAGRARAEGRDSGDTAVLIVDGEELVGAKQESRRQPDDARSRRTRRWSSRCRAWSPAAGATINARVRVGAARAIRGRASREDAECHGIAPQRQQQPPLESGRGLEPDPPRRRPELDAPSPTSAMSSICEAPRRLHRRVRQGVHARRAAGGAVFFINGRVAGLELFDAASTWRAISPKLRSYAIDAIDRPRTEVATPSPESAKAFCTALAASAWAPPSAGRGWATTSA